MSQPRRRKSMKSLSQPSTSNRDPAFTEEDERIASSQLELDNSLSNEEHAHNVANAVKYILAADQSKTPIVRTTISKCCNCTGKHFRGVINTAQQVLLDVFGYELIELENGKFILFNTIKNEIPHLEFSEETETRYALLFLTLAHIFMNGEVCTEDSILNFFKKLNIIRDGDLRNSDFGGNVLEIITNDFVKEKYIDVAKSENSENSEQEFRWGKRAECELSVRLVMEFVSEMYGDRDIQTWSQQYKSMLRKETAAGAHENGVHDNSA